MKLHIEHEKAIIDNNFIYLIFGTKFLQRVSKLSSYRSSSNLRSGDLYRHIYPPGIALPIFNQSL
jgi:hypothetical protein